MGWLKMNTKLRFSSIVALGKLALFAALPLSLPCAAAANFQETDPRKSVIVWDTTALEPLTFQKTIWNIVRENIDFQPDTPIDMEKTVSFVEALLKTLKLQSAVNANGQQIPLIALLPADSDFRALARRLLDPKDDLGLVPTAALNRFDLAPYSLDDCGEFRIVYSLKKPVVDAAELIKRFFLIFESRVGNVEPKAESESAIATELINGCKEIIKKWQGFPKKKNSVIATDLEAFFYEKVAEGLPRAILAKWIGGEQGQIRGNIKIKDSTGRQIWQLRQWQLNSTDSKLPIPETAALTDSPRVELFENYSTARQPSDNEVFQTKFAETAVEFLRNPAACGPSTYSNCPLGDSANGLLNRLGIPKTTERVSKIISDAHLDFQNITSNTDNLDELDSISKRINFYDDFKENIRKLGNEHLPRGHIANEDHVLLRMQAISCAGCHQFSQNSGHIGSIGDVRIKWPRSKRFVHIGEPRDNTTYNVRLSEALTDNFTPFRRKINMNFSINKFLEKEIDVKKYIFIRNARNNLKTKQFNDINYKTNINIHINTIKNLKEGEKGLFVQFRRSH